MKKTLLSLLFAVAVLSAGAQDYGKITVFAAQNKLEEALKELQKLEADKKGSTNPSTTMWKAYVYGEILLDSNLRSKYPDAESIVLASLDELKTKDPSGALMKEKGLRPLQIVYAENFNAGRAFFTAKDWKAAFAKFKVAEKLGDYVSKNGFTNTKQNIDTLSVIYAGYSAQNAQLRDEAAYYYEKAIAENLNTEEYTDVYRYVVDYYSKKGDQANFQKILNLARKAYPGQSALWNEYEMESKTAGASLTDLVAQYRQGVETMSVDQILYYADLFGNPDKDKLAKLDSAQRMEIRKAAIEAFGKSYNQQKNALYAYNAGVLNYQTFNDLQDRFYEYKGETPALKAKRAAVETEMLAVANESIKWLEMAYADLKIKTDRNRNENTSLGNSVKDLTVLFGWKRDRARGKDLKAYDAAEAKYKIYDAEYGKY